jgi:type IV pilus assembly protein PilE
MMRNGFSLIEVMLALFIVALLMAFSVPYYGQYVQHEHRIVAETNLLKLAGALEQYYLINNSYAGASLENVGFNALLMDKYYQFQIAQASASGFLIAAQPINKQAQDTVCARLSLNELGEKKFSGNGVESACW